MYLNLTIESFKQGLNTRNDAEYTISAMYCIEEHM